MTTHTALEKLTKTEFDSYEDWQTYPTADYTCDKCNQIISIAFKNLVKHQFSNFTNFDDEDKRTFEKYESMNGQIKTNSFIDFCRLSCYHYCH